MERLGPLDATFLAIEDACNHMHIGSVGVFEGPAPAYAEVRADLAAKLPLVPRYRQKVRTAPGAIGRPLWIDDPHFNVDYHVRHTALPPPGGDAELRTLVGRVMSQQLDRHKPLWETWMIEGLGDGRWALLTKVHHCMVDGIAGTDLLAVILESTADPVAAPVDDWTPEPEPSAAGLAAHSARGLAVRPFELARSMGDAMRTPRATAARLVDVLRGIVPMGGAVLTPAPSSTLTGPIGPHRRWAFTRVSLADVKTVRRTLGGTVNDVILAVVAGGFRSLLESRGEHVEGRTVRTLVPVSVRTPDARGVFDNRVSSVYADLPVGVADPVDRLLAVRRQLDALKTSGEAQASEAVLTSSGFAPPALAAAFARVVVHRQLAVETITTNVPGPQQPLYMHGRRMVEAYPFVPLAGRIRVAVAIWSYDGALHFGVTGDWEGAPDLDVVAAGVDAGMRDLLEAARARAARTG